MSGDSAHVSLYAAPGSASEQMRDMLTSARESAIDREELEPSVIDRFVDSGRAVQAEFAAAVEELGDPEPLMQSGDPDGERSDLLRPSTSK